MAHIFLFNNCLNSALHTLYRALSNSMAQGTISCMHFVLKLTKQVKSHKILKREKIQEKAHFKVDGAKPHLLEHYCGHIISFFNSGWSRATTFSFMAAFIDTEILRFSPQIAKLELSKQFYDSLIDK